MTKAAVRRRAAAFGSALGALLLSAAAVPSSASADSGRAINSYVTCSDGTLMYGFAINYGSGWTYTALGASGYQVNSQEKEVTFIVPTTANSVALDTYCGGNGYVENSNWVGYTYSLTPGTSTATANWVCSLYQYAYYGYYTTDRSCNLTSISYG
ncbi:hypothetical protein [Actinocrinis sp.]|uniref:hypothetical protein n=1 Tax=Actinocrinis sp. TaxID=1920516 RepID=UPI002D50CDF7|nr:hypothetical protein [Actinocrinis sp.]HZP52883.1 hypothetical protein [Actinocrinis sp.]